MFVRINRLRQRETANKTSRAADDGARAERAEPRLRRQALVNNDTAVGSYSYVAFHSRWEGRDMACCCVQRWRSGLILAVLLHR